MRPEDQNALLTAVLQRLLGRIIASLLTAFSLGLSLSGCGEPTDSKQAVPGAIGVGRACSACHTLPPPDALPKSAWPTVMEQMSRIADAAAVTLHANDIAEAQAFFASNSPASLDKEVAEPERVESDLKLWSAVQLSPAGLEDALVPAVSHVAIGTMAAGEPLSLLASEMRSRSLLHLPLAGDPDSPPVFYPMLRDLNYPGRLVWSDLNGDGQTDFVIPGIGSMQPNNATNGNVTVALQQSGRQFLRQIVAKQLGRPAAVCSGDFDGDGDRDIAVAAFGLRDAGQLALLENQGANEEMRLLQLDARDGFTSLEAVDVDGDGPVDIVALLAQEHEELIVFKNEGALQFSTHLIWKAAHPSWAFSHLQIADLDSNGKPDIVTTNGDSLDYNVIKPYSGVQWFQNTGQLTFQPMTIGALPGAACAAAADMDGDGDLDIAATAFMPLSAPAKWIENDLKSVVWFENPAGQGIAPSATWIMHVVEQHSACHPTIALADCDADGFMDIVVGNYVWIDEEKGPLFRSPYVSIYSRRQP
ncbi:MAG: VCBS repeat-containing protein [Verrucomicrobia bacterium]|nr:VCBS repeat-containing protein [Verrucomicrobiota bacterium]